MDDALKSLGLNPNKDKCPILVGLREDVTIGAYTLILEFDSPLIPLETWVTKQERIEAFFGPGIQVELTQPEVNRVNLSMVATPTPETAAV